MKNILKIAQAKIQLKSLMYDKTYNFGPKNYL